jgi:hypothetical protein
MGESSHILQHCDIGTNHGCPFPAFSGSNQVSTRIRLSSYTPQAGNRYEASISVDLVSISSLFGTVLGAAARHGKKG